MPFVVAKANSVEISEKIGGVQIGVFHGTEAECEAYLAAHSTDETTPIPGWSPVTDGDLLVIQE